MNTIGSPCSCHSGAFGQQSPVDLRNPVHADLGERGLQVAWEGPADCVQVEGAHGRHVEVHDTAHSLQLDEQQFTLKSFHCHTPSEHKVDDQAYPLELHMVHQNPATGNLAVVGIFVTEGPGAGDPRISKFLDEVEAAQQGGPVHVDPKVFLPEFPSQYYRYEGSLTTAPYDANVSWVVMRHPLVVDSEQMEQMHDLFEKEARPTQPLNRRFVLASFPGD